MTTKQKAARTALLVTTEHRGVFFGYGEKPNGSIPDALELKDARMCVSWSADVRGVHGLAAVGPSKNCRVGIKVPSLTLNKITSIAECSDEATQQWEKGPWV